LRPRDVTKIKMVLVTTFKKRTILVTTIKILVTAIKSREKVKEEESRVDEL